MYTKTGRVAADGWGDTAIELGGEHELLDVLHDGAALHAGSVRVADALRRFSGGVVFFGGAAVIACNPVR